MGNTTSEVEKNRSLCIAIIFLLTGLFLGSGFVLCVLDFVPIGAITLRVFGSLCVGGAILSAITAYKTLDTTCREVINGHS